MVAIQTIDILRAPIAQEERCVAPGRAVTQTRVSFLADAASAGPDGEGMPKGVENDFRADG